jgi:hypothetical protein
MSRNSITPSRAFFDELASGDDLLLLGAGSAQLPAAWAARLHLDQAHPAIAGDGQPLMIAEARDLLAGHLARLQHGGALRHLDLDTIDFDFRHSSSSSTASAERHAQAGNNSARSCRGPAPR